MKKKEKKINSQQLKQEEIHQKNCYLQRIKAMMEILGDASAYDCLSLTGVDILYMTRIRPVKLISSDIPALKVSKSDLNKMNEVLNQLLRGKFVSINPQKKQISLYDFMCYTETVYFFWRNVKKGDCLHPEAFKQKFPIFNDFEDKRLEAHSIKDDYIRFISWAFTKLGHFYVRIEFEILKLNTTSFNAKAFYNNYIVYFEKPETELFEIDRHKRAIFRIGIYHENEFIGLTLTPEQLGINGLLKNIPLKVYIQRHALERITERIGDFFTVTTYTEIIRMVSKHHTFPSGDGGFLFPYTYMNKRLGYLKADIFGDQLIFRTFLFLTNNGTPEGKKLANLLGIQKADKKYLGIDNLNTFINSDIESNENLKRVFCQAGCSDLFELKKAMKVNSSPSIHCANFLENYLGLNREKLNMQMD
ncbi:MAG TPA: hypothetical protein VFC67_19850 [Prolixibacteraceae bacterium]|nr:hypothetical protein [Prolixibacteraceae bacterium]